MVSCVNDTTIDKIYQYLLVSLLLSYWNYLCSNRKWSKLKRNNNYNNNNNDKNRQSNILLQYALKRLTTKDLISNMNTMDVHIPLSLFVSVCLKSDNLKIFDYEKKGIKTHIKLCTHYKCNTL